MVGPRLSLRDHFSKLLQTVLLRPSLQANSELVHHTYFRFLWVSRLNQSQILNFATFSIVLLLMRISQAPADRSPEEFAYQAICGIRMNVSPET